MATNFTMEQLEAAKAEKSPEELVAKAKEQGYDIPLERAAAFLNPEAVKTEEIADEELDNVAGGHGGKCHNGGREVVTTFTSCVHDLPAVPPIVDVHGNTCFRYCGSINGRNSNIGIGNTDCEWLSYEKGLWLCNYPEHLKK